MLLYWALLLGALYLFGSLAGEVYEREGFFFDGPLLTFLDTHQTPALTAAAQFFSFVGSVYLLGPLGLLLVATLVAWLGRRSRRTVIFLVLGAGGAVALNYLFKAVFARTRPELYPQLSPVGGYSFPSGHTMASTAFFLTLYLILRQLRPRLAPAVGALGLLLSVAIPVAVGVSRMYLQVHYPSDVLAGWALSSAWVLGVRLWYVRG